MLLAAVSSVSLVGGVANADDKTVREAQARFEEGLKRVKAGDFEAARMSFVQAYVVLHKPDILWNLALSEEKSARPLDALAHFKEFARQAPTDADRARAQKHVDVLMAQTGHIEVQAPAGTPLLLDGTTGVGMAPLADTLDVTPGHHVIEGKLAEGTKALSVDAVAGEVARVTFLVVGPDRPVASVAVASTPAPEGSAPAAAPSTGAPAADASARDDARGTAPVSYTHLDVYKRQITSLPPDEYIVQQVVITRSRSPFSKSRPASRRWLWGRLSSPISAAALRYQASPPKRG